VWETCSDDDDDDDEDGNSVFHMCRTNTSNYDQNLSHAAS